MKMKINSILFILAITVCGSATNTYGQNKAVMTFDTMQYDFGIVKVGAKAEHTFVFKNTGDQDIVINEVKTTFFCTASEWTKGAIAPGKKGKIDVSFDTEGKSGPYAKGINVYSTAGESNLIIFIEVEGVVVEPPKDDSDDHKGHKH